MRESNSHQKFWRLLSYHLTNPLYIIVLFQTINIITYLIHFCKCTFKTSYKVQEFQTANNLTKVVISIPLCFISMILLRKTPSVSSAISADKSAPCHFLHPAVFLRFGQALDRLVTVSSMCCHTSTSALSTL